MIKKEDYTIYYIWLSEAVGRSYKAYRELISAFGNVYDIYRADADEYMHLSGNVRRHIEGLCDKSIGKAVSVSDFCRGHGIHIITYESDVYPSLLKNIESPPLVLYVRGRLPDFEGKLHISAVGTRRMTEYGKEIAYNFGYSLAKNGAVLVSGMALGCDAAAMCGALDAGGFAIGVLGCGVDIAYPPEHAHFMRHVERHGALISEYPPGTRAEPSHFPERNRIISGLSRALIVVEGDIKSGAMISARHAISQGRAVFAVPGRLGEKSSEGAVSLLSDGARLAREATDVLREYALLYRGKIDLKSYDALSSEQIDARLYARGVSKSKGSRRAPKAESKSINKPIKENLTEEQPSQKSGGMFASFVKIKDSKKQKEEESGKDTSMLSAELRTIYEKLPKGEMFASDDVAKYGISARDFMSGVTMLEIYGLAVSYPGGRYILK